MSFSNCEFHNNRAIYQGGVFYTDHDSLLLLKHCDLDHNTAIYGGAINVVFSTVNIESCLFHRGEAMEFEEGSFLLSLTTPPLTVFLYAYSREFVL